MFHRVDTCFALSASRCRHTIQILEDGVILSRVLQGTTDGEVFEKFIEQLLHRCGRWPEPKSVLVMDNTSNHHSDRIQQMCSDAGVKLVCFAHGSWKLLMTAIYRANWKPI